MILNPEKAYTYFQNHFQIRATTKGWHKFDCPQCDYARGKSKAAVKFEWDRVKCWECGMSYWITDFIAWAEDITHYHVYRLIETYDATDIELCYEDPLRALGEIKVSLPQGFKRLSSEGVIGMKARAYLSNRGFDIEELDQEGFGYCAEHNEEDFAQDYFGYIIIPYKSKGQLIYYQGRDFFGNNKMKYKNPPTELFGIGKGDCIFNEDALYLEDINFVTEGWACAKTIGDMGVSTQGWSLSSRQLMLLVNSNANKIVFCPDIGQEEGISFYKKALQTALYFTEIKDTYVLDLSTIVKGKQKDVNDIGRLPIFELFESVEATPLTYSDIILKLL